MSTFVKKATSAVAGLAIVFSVVSPIAGVSAALSGLEAANELSTLGIIVDQSANPADYRLGDNLPRREAVKVMMSLSSISVPENCNGVFNDLSSDDWGCKYAETALENGFVAANANFRPGDLVSKVEALKMVFQGRNLERADNADWRAGYVEAAVSLGIATSFTDYDTAASRAEMFIWAAEAINLNGEVATETPAADEDPLCELLGICEDEGTETPTTPTSPSTPTTPTAPTGPVNGGVVVSLSPSTPEASTVPGGANGVPVAAFDVTAGSSDVTLDGFILKRKGLSDEDTLTALAVFGEDGRVSKSRDDSQENDDQANLNFNEEEVVRAGETRTFLVVADINRNGNTAEVTNDEFAIELLDIEANTDVTFDGRLVGETFRIAGVDAPQVTFSPDGSVTDPTLGEKDAEIFKFEIEGADDEDVIIRSITFRSSETDVEDNLRNFKLTQNNDVLATTEKTTEEFLTFNLGDGYVIEEDTDLSFVVTADVIEGALDEFSFFIDRNLDVTAISTKFDTVASVDISEVDEEDDLGTVEIEAGELVIRRINPTVDEIKSDKDDVVLGEFTIVNESGGDLDLEELGIRVDLSGNVGGSGFTAGSNAAVNVNVESIFDDFEILNKNTGRTDTLELGSARAVPSGWSGSPTDNISSGVYEDDSLGINIPEGETTFVIRADTADEIANFNDVSIALSFQTGRQDAQNRSTRHLGFFVVEEQDDDEEVEDISPSFISFDNLDGIESTAELSANPLATSTAVRGAEGVEVLEFEVEADEASTLEIDEIRIRGEFVNIDAATIAAGNGLSAIAGITEDFPISNQQLSNISIYLDSVSDANLLESRGGNDIENNGEITFNDFDNIFIQPNQTQTFVVVVDIIDGDTVENIGLRNFEVVDIDIDDEDNDDIVATGTALSGNRILVTGAGLLTASFDDSNEANEDPKTILAGTDGAVVFSVDVQSTNEPTDVEDVVFTLAGPNLTDIRNTIANASLYLDGVLVDTNTNSDIDELSATSATITFDDLDTLIVPEQTSELELRLNTESIGFQRVGSSLTGVTVTAVDFSEIEGDESDEDVLDVSITGTSQQFDIVRGTLIPRISGGSNTSNPTIGVDALLGDNRAENDNTIPNIVLNSISLDVTGTTAGTIISISNSDGNTPVVQTVGTTSIVVFDVTSFPAADRIISSGNEEFFEIQITPNAQDENVTVSIELTRDGLNYTVEGETFTTNASEDLEIATYQE